MQSRSSPRGGVSLDAKRRALKSFLASGYLKPGTQLYSLLVYLGEKSLEGEEAPIKEYTIGVEVLHKPEDYDPRTDPVVRVNMAKLRKKLEEYYRREGREDPVRLEIPRGDYHLRFRALPSRPSFPRAGFVAYLLGIGGLSVVLLAALSLRDPPSGESADDLPVLTPELGSFWEAYLEKDPPTVLVYGTPLFIKMDRYYFRDPQLNRSGNLEENPTAASVAEALRSSHVRPVYDYTGVGEAEALFLLTRFLTAQRIPLTVQASHQTSWAGLREKNVIFLGSTKFNPQLAELPYPPAFESQGRRLVRLRPLPGQADAFHRVYDAPHGTVLEDYPLVSLYPGLTPGTRLMVLSSSLSPGTAAEFVTRTETLATLFQKMGVEPLEGDLPPAFQVVVRFQLNRGVPLRLFYVTHEILETSEPP